METRGGGVKMESINNPCMCRGSSPVPCVGAFLGGCHYSLAPPFILPISKIKKNKSLVQRHSSASPSSSKGTRYYF